MSSLNEDILRALECPSCLEQMITPIFTCEGGHSICGSCIDKLRKCPQCERVLNTRRNYSLESVAELLLYPCPNVERGCQGMYRIADMDEHSTACSFRRYPCLLPTDFDEGCVWTGQRIELAGHAFNCHKANAWMRVKNVDKWTPADAHHDIQMVLAFNQIFYLHRKLVEEEAAGGGGVMHWVLQYVGNSEDVIQYCFQLRVFSEEYAHRDIVANEIYHDDLMTVDEMIETGICVAIPVALLHTFKNVMGEVCYDVTIKKT